MSLQQKLIELSQIDAQLRGLRSRVDAGQRRAQALETKLNQLRQQHSELEDQQKHAAAKGKVLEDEASGVDEKIAKLRDQMNTVTSNKEYQALLVEANTIKLEKGKMEEEALSQMQSADEMATRLTVLAEQIEEQQKLLELATKEVQDATSEIKDRLEAVEKQRAEMSGQIPPDILQVYEFNLENHDGEPLGIVEEQDRRRREYICGGCFMQLPIERVNTLLTRPDELVQCPSCQRILVVDEELRESMQPA